MNILQIWTVGKLSPHEVKCIKRVKEIYPNDKYILITDGVEEWPIKPDEIITKKEYDRVIWDRASWEFCNPHPFCDFAQWVYLTTHPDTLYIDVDFYSLTPVPSGEKPGIYSNDIGLMYSGQSCDKIDQAFEKRDRKSIILRNCGDILREESFILDKYFKPI